MLFLAPISISSRMHLSSNCQHCPYQHCLLRGMRPLLWMRVCLPETNVVSATVDQSVFSASKRPAWPCIEHQQISDVVVQSSLRRTESCVPHDRPTKVAELFQTVWSITDASASASATPAAVLADKGLMDPLSPSAPHDDQLQHITNETLINGHKRNKNPNRRQRKMLKRAQLAIEHPDTTTTSQTARPTVTSIDITGCILPMIISHRPYRSNPGPSCRVITATKTTI